MPELFAFDFDKTLTIEHTFEYSQMYTKGRKVQDPTFASQISDDEIRQNLRNPLTIKAIIEDLAIKGHSIAIVSRHDNALWILRNLRILFGNPKPPFFEAIKIAPLQYSDYLEKLQEEKLPGNKQGAINSLCKALKVFGSTLIDDDPMEGENLNKDETSFIHADPSNDAYLYTIAEKAGIDKRIVALNHYMDKRNARSEEEYTSFLGSVYAFFGLDCYTKKQKFEAANALIRSLNCNTGMDKKYRGALFQGELRKIIKEQNINLNSYIR